MEDEKLFGVKEIMRQLILQAVKDSYVKALKEIIFATGEEHHAACWSTYEAKTETSQMETK